MSDGIMQQKSPENMEEYARRFAMNSHVTGYGIENTTSHVPCPFCAAPEFMVFRVIDTEIALEKGARCKECTRQAKAIVTRSAGGVAFEIVQTHGPDAPDWLMPKMRRV